LCYILVLYHFPVTHWSVVNYAVCKQLLHFVYHLVLVINIPGYFRLLLLTYFFTILGVFRMGILALESRLFSFMWCGSRKDESSGWLSVTCVSALCSSHAFTLLVWQQDLYTSSLKPVPKVLLLMTWPSLGNSAAKVLVVLDPRHLPVRIFKV